MKQNFTVFTEGDANEKKTWSNVPYFLTKTLEKKGNTVNRINVNGNIILRGMYNHFIIPIIKKFYNRESTFYYNRTKFYTNEVNYKMKKALNNYKDTDIFISTSFSYSPAKFTNKKSVMFCDWTYDYYFKYFLNREPDKMELKEILRQNMQIENADYIISLFPDIAEYMKCKYRNKNIYYLGNVINSEITASEDTILNEKRRSLSILFIGSNKYLKGAKCLIEAFKMIKKEKNIVLHIVGIPKSMFENIPKGVYCYGYLDKNKKEDKNVYYSLIQKSKLYVNTNPIWAAFSATVESMYYYNPVITTPYQSYTETFGPHINFGYYCNKNDPKLVYDYIKKIFDMDDQSYLELCKNSHSAVQEFTWSAYVDRMLKIINNSEL